MATENKLNWKKDLDKFSLLNTKILYMIYYFFNIKHFDKEQKKKLKELVILENSDIINSFKKFEKNSNLNDLEKDFQKIYNNEKIDNIKKESKSIIHIAYESSKEEKNKQNIEVNDDEDDEDVDDNEDDEDKNIELLNSPMGRELMERKKKKQKKNEKKTFITNALGKMKHNDSESDDEGDY